MRIALETHGCRLNQAESDAMAQVLVQAGHEIVAADKAQLLILNTCTITHNADADARSRVRRAKRASPEQEVLLTGCYANSAPEQAAALPGVSAVVGNHEKQEIAQLVSKLGHATPGQALVSVASLTRRLSSSGRMVGAPREASALPAAPSRVRTRALLKIQDGCNYSCSFCIVPQVRGANRSYPRPSLVQRFQQLCAHKVPEVVLTGVHLGTYGWDFQERDGLERLVADLLGSGQKARIRLGSLDPHELRPGLIELMRQAGGKGLCRHLHLPVQSGSDRILAAMRRAHRRQDLLEVIPKLRNACSGVAVGTDFIVGFPGEDQNAFDESYALFETMGLDYAHVFSYSKRRGTSAATMPDQVPEPIKRKRNTQFRALSDKHWQSFAQSQAGQELQAVVLDSKRGPPQALTDNYLRVHLPEGSGLRPGTTVPLRITQVTLTKLEAQPL